MESPRLGWMLASAVLALASCKDKASSGGESNAGATAPSPTPSAAPAPVPSAAPPVPAMMSSLMGFEGEIDMMAKGSDPDKPAQPVSMLVKGDKLRLDVIPGTEATAALGKGFLLVRVADKKLEIALKLCSLIREYIGIGGGTEQGQQFIQAHFGQKSHHAPP